MHVDDSSIERALTDILPLQKGLDHIGIGTGTGRILEVVAPHTWKVIDIDFSHKMLTVARSNLAQSELSNCDVRYGDMRQLDLPSESFDVATFHLVVHYADDPAFAIREAARLLRPGGRIIVIDFAPHNEARLRDIHAHRWLGFTDSEIKRWFRGAELSRGLPCPSCQTAAKATSGHAAE